MICGAPCSWDTSPHNPELDRSRGWELVAPERLALSGWPGLLSTRILPNPMLGTGFIDTPSRLRSSACRVHPIYGPSGPLLPRLDVGVAALVISNATKRV